jgi:hypothetical protein
MFDVQMRATLTSSALAPLFFVALGLLTSSNIRSHNNIENRVGDGLAAARSARGRLLV